MNKVRFNDSKEEVSPVIALHQEQRATLSQGAIRRLEVETNPHTCSALDHLSACSSLYFIVPITSPFD